MKRYIRKTWDYIETIEQATKSAEIETCLLDLALQHGLTSAFGGLVPPVPVGRSEIEQRTLLQHLPSEWAQRYNEKAYLFRDPIMHRLRSDGNPFTWNDAYASCSCRDDVKVIQGEASEFGLQDGYVIPVTMLDGGISVISFGGSHIDIDDEGRSALAFATSYALARLLHQRSVRDGSPGDLSPREFDCLQWAAEGKTDWEISKIFGISTSTVTKHLLSAREKLGAVNKAHAVAMAMRMKVLR